MNRGPSIVLAIVAVVAAGATAVWLGNRSIEKSTPAAVASSAAPRASEVYASDGTTLVVRFDGDPRNRCLALTNSWGSYCDYLVSWWQAQPVFGSSPAQRLERLRTGGYRIVGSLNLAVQATAQRQLEPAGDPAGFSIASVAPGTGFIRALAVDQRRSPTVAVDGSGTSGPTGQGGATFMMFTAIAAFEAGLRLDHTIDTKRVYQTHFRIHPSDPQACGAAAYWCPVNFGDRRYLSGPRTVWSAFTHAVATYFVALEEAIGVEKAVDVAGRLGIRFTGVDKDLAENHPAQWGAFTLGVSQVSALDLANAYATLAADGMRCEPRPVQAVTDAGGRAVRLAPNCARAVSPEVARAAVDAGRCAVGDRSASGDVCGPGAVPASAVRASAGRSVTGQFGVDRTGTRSALVVTSPGLSTAGILTASKASPGSAVLVAAVSRVHHDGLATVPDSDFAPPPQSLVTGHS